MPTPPVHRYAYRVRVADANALGRLGLVRVIDLMQDAAWQHAAGLGASMATLQAEGVAWVLARLRVEMQRYPQLGETVWVETWPSGEERSLVYRDFRLWDEAAQLLGQATTTWLVFDLAARQFRTLPTNIRKLLPTVAEPPLPRANGRWSQPALADDAPAHPVHWWHIDLNQHVNHSHYVRWALTGLPTPLPEEARCRRLELILRRECRIGDMLRSAVQPLSADTFSHALYRESDQQLIMQMRSIWQPQTQKNQGIRST